MGKAYENRIYDESFEASADLSAKQFFCVKIHSVDNQVALGTDGAAVGLLQNKPKANEAAAVRVVGVSKGVAGAAINRNVKVSSDANGKLKAAATGNAVIGITITSSGAADEFLSVLMPAPSLG